MKKIFLIVFGILLGVSGIVYASNNFPTSFNNWSAGGVISSSWGNSLEAKIGIDNSLATSSLDYKASQWTRGTSTLSVSSTTLSVGIGTTTPSFPLTVVSSSTQQTGIYIEGNYNGFYQGNIKNKNTSSLASTDWVATASNGNDSIHYVDMGINGSGGGAIPFTSANETYLYSASDNFNIAALGSTSTLKIWTASTTATTTAPITIASNGFVGIASGTPVSQLTVGPYSANGSSTISMGKIQFEGRNSANVRYCLYIDGTPAWAFKPGSCTQ